MDFTAVTDVISAFLAAVVLGGVIGVERERQHKPAGCRTYMLVTGSAAVFIGMGKSLLEGFEGSSTAEMVKADPIRLVQAIIIGLGFIGGGLMQQKEDKSHNLSTAAAFLMAAGIGIYCGVHKYAIAVTLTLLTVVILHVLGKIEKKLEK